MRLSFQKPQSHDQPRQSKEEPFTSLDVEDGLYPPLHTYTLPAIGAIQEVGGDDGACHGSQVLLYTPAGHSDELAQNVPAY